MRTGVHASLLSTLLLAVVAWPSASFAVVACDADAVLVVTFCDPPDSCFVFKEIVCDDSCGPECVYDFGPERLITFGAKVRSTGPPMRFKALGMALHPRTRVPGIETVPGGFIGFDVGGFHLLLSRPIVAPGGTIEVSGAVGEAPWARNSSSNRLDVSGPDGGGTIRLLTGISSLVSLLAKGTGPDAPGGQILIESRDPVLLNLPETKIHRFDASGATGGRIVMGAVSKGGNILAHGRKGAGGSIEIDGTLNLAGTRPIYLRECFNRRGGVIRVDGRTTGGSFVARGGSAIEICQTIRAHGGKQGGSVLLEAPSIKFGKIKAWGRRGPGGTVQLFGPAIPAGRRHVVKSRIDVRGAPGGRVELISDSGGVLQDVFADGRRGADAGTIYIGEENDPPSGVGGFGVRGKISARSRDGQGGRVTMRGCRIGRNVQEPASIEVSGTGAQMLFQGRLLVQLPLTLEALGPMASIRVEYGSAFLPADSSTPEPEVVQYPNPACDCTMTLAECMTPP